MLERGSMTIIPGSARFRRLMLAMGRNKHPAATRFGNQTFPAAAWHPRPLWDRVSTFASPGPSAPKGDHAASETLLNRAKRMGRSVLNLVVRFALPDRENQFQPDRPSFGSAGM